MSLDWGVIVGIIGGVIFGITAIVFVVLWIIGTCRKYRGGEQRHSPGSTGTVHCNRCFIVQNTGLNRLDGQAKASI